MSPDFVPMNSLQLRKLPLSSTGFEVLRSSGQIYVDKAQLVLNISTLNACYFISRPRRFGKTLLISTFASLFEHGLKYFEGLKIEKQYRKFWEKEKTYKVLRLDFSLCSVFSDVKEFLIAFENHLSNALIESGFSLPKKNWEQDTLVSRFDRLLDSLDNASLVLLIDEYDAPLNHCLDDDRLFSKVKNELDAFYLDLKKQSPKMRFVFMTGVSKYKNLGIFSGANQFTDLSLMSDYGTLLGYTQEEIEEYFSPFVENAAKVLNLSYEACLQKMATYYDGYCFDNNVSTHVFTPWSVLNFLKYPQNGFNNYWYASGGHSSILLNYISKNGLKSPDEFEKDVCIESSELESSLEPSLLNPEVLLYQAGYLTIKRRFSPVALILNYPDLEVADSMARVYVDKFVKGKSWLNLYTEFMEHTPEQIIEFLNNNLLAIPYIAYPVENESVLRAILGCCIKSSGLEARFEESNACGRSDLEVRAGKRYFVIELKYAREEAQADQLLALAEAQIKARHYGEQNGLGLMHVYMALVFSGKERRFVKYSVF